MPTPMENELPRLERILGEVRLSALLLSIAHGENNWKLAERYGLTIYDTRFLAKFQLECALLLLDREVKVARVLRMIA